MDRDKFGNDVRRVDLRKVDVCDWRKPRIRQQLKWSTNIFVYLAL